MATRTRLNADQLRHAADALARGESRASVARVLGWTDRSMRRALADPEHPLAKAAASRQREHERVEHLHAKRSAAVQGLPAPLPPSERRAQVTAFEEAERQATAQPPPLPQRVETADDEILRWILAAEPTNEREYLDRRDAEQGVISAHARRRFTGQTSPPQFRIIGIDTNASLLAESMRPPAWVDDPFKGHYAR